MKAVSQILSEQAEEAFKIVGKVYAEGGGLPDAKQNVREVLQVVWTLSRQYAIADVCRQIRDKLDSITE